MDPAVSRSCSRDGHDRSPNSVHVDTSFGFHGACGQQSCDHFNDRVATIAAAVGAGGLGEFIFRGLAMVNDQLILAGAIPAAALALTADFLLSLLERRLRPAQ